MESTTLVHMRRRAQAQGAIWAERDIVHVVQQPRRRVGSSIGQAYRGVEARCSLSRALLLNLASSRVRWTASCAYGIENVRLLFDWRGRRWLRCSVCYCRLFKCSKIDSNANGPQPDAKVEVLRRITSTLAVASSRTAIGSSRTWRLGTFRTLSVSDVIANATLQMWKRYKR